LWIIQPQISPPILSAARSSPVKTASTPGMASAALGVDRLDGGVRVRRAHEIGVGLARTVDVVGVAALAGDEANIFLATDGRRFRWRS
jgi:hypothetical protein